MVYGRNERLKQIQKAARNGESYDQFAVTESELVANCGGMVLLASQQAQQYMKAFLRAEKARTGFVVDTSSPLYQELQRFGLQRLPADLKAPSQQMIIDSKNAKTRLGRLLWDSVRAAGYKQGDIVKFSFEAKFSQGTLKSLDEEKGCFNVYPTPKSSIKVPAFDIISKDNRPIISRERWTDMFRHIK